MSWCVVLVIGSTDVHGHINPACSQLLKHESHWVVLILFVGVLLHVTMERSDCGSDVWNHLRAGVQYRDHPSDQLVRVDHDACISNSSVAITASDHETG